MVIHVLPLIDPEVFERELYGGHRTSLGDLLAHAPALSTVPIDRSWLSRDLKRLDIRVHNHWPANDALYWPPDMHRPGDGAASATPDVPRPAAPEDRPVISQQPSGVEPPAASGAQFPNVLTEADAVRLAYSEPIQRAASFLRAGLSVLVECDKLVADYLGKRITDTAALRPVPLTLPADDDPQSSRTLRQRQLIGLKKLVEKLQPGDVLVIPHLDLLAGGSPDNPLTEARELIELVYQVSAGDGNDPTRKGGDCLVLAFADPSFQLPKVLADRFAARLSIRGVPREVEHLGKKRPLGELLVTKDEADRIEGYDPHQLFKYVAGMNPIRLRHAIRYVVEQWATTQRLPASKLAHALQEFKAQRSSDVEIPQVKFDDIGGLDDVKAELQQAIRLLMGRLLGIKESLKHELIPRGFIFYGPPGTGKTLLAKAVAHQMEGTIQIVSGPEVTDMYVGEGERKVRELFAEARRNAPSVLVFEEFDSIAGKRTGRDDGGSRAGNALVAQILTEMDGFRPDVAMLVIGTTNRYDMIDRALLRPARFRAIEIGLPERPARRKIAEIHARRYFDDQLPEELLDLIASDATDGLNADHIRSLFRDAYVGQYCSTPAKPANAARFGELVGRLRAEEHAGKLSEAK